MNDSALKDIANEQTPIYTALRGFINSTNYINIGVISKIHDENYVDVNLYYTDSTGRKVIIQAVRLLHIGTTKCKINIVPAVGDNVLLICPKDFIEKIEYNRVPAESGVCYIPYGNINTCGILIKDESDDNVITTIGIDEEGTINLKTEGNLSVNLVKDDDSVRATLDVNKDGAIAITSEDTVSLECKKDVTVKTDKDAKVTASNIVAMCSSFVVKADENSSAVFEVTT